MHKLELNFKTLIFLLAFAAVLWLAWQVRGVLLLFFIAMVIAAGLRPLVWQVHRWLGISRGLATLLTYIGFFLLVLAVGIVVVGALNQQLKELLSNFPEISSRFISNLEQNLPWLGNVVPLQEVQSNLNSLPTALTSERIISLVGSTFGLFSSAVSTLVSGFTVIIMSAYLINSEDDLFSGVVSRLRTADQEFFRKLLTDIHTKLGEWIRGQLLLMLFIGGLTYILLQLPRLFIDDYQLGDFALPLAIAAGILELVPTIGPLLTLALSLVLAIGTGGSAGLGIYILASFTILQNIESTFIVPAIMKRAVDLHPVVVILSVLAGFELGGVIGALLAVPFVLTVQIIASNVLDHYYLQSETGGRKRS